MSTTQTPGPIELRQRYADQFEAIQTHLDGRQVQIHTSMPGHVVSYDPATMTATVQPALQVFHTQVDGTRVPTTITPITHVPVHFPGGGGHTMTFPVAAGDECMIHFAERSIDNWYQHGGVQAPSDWRMHDINDAICTVGLRSQPKVPGGVSGDSVQIRSDSGTTFIDINGVGGSVTITTDNAVTLNCAVLKVNGDIECTGSIAANRQITAMSGGAFVTVSEHIHPGNEEPPEPGT